MAFTELNYMDENKNVGGVVLASEPYAIDLIEVNTLDKGKVVPGNIAYSTAKGELATDANKSGNAVGIFVKNSVGLGQEDAKTEYTEVATAGTVFVNLTLGEASPVFGQLAATDGDRVKIDAAGDFGMFTGVIGESMDDGSIVAQLKIK